LRALCRRLRRRYRLQPVQHAQPAARLVVHPQAGTCRVERLLHPAEIQLQAGQPDPPIPFVVTAAL
jgi:hypothetical protein